MRTRLGWMMIAFSALCGIVLLATNYAGYSAHGTWHTGEILIAYDMEWESHWMWITPICVVFAAGVLCLVFPNPRTNLRQTLDSDD